jgi:hypothetical protein
MSIASFASDLVGELQRRALPKSLVQEQDLEQAFVLPIAARLAARQRGVRLYAHPWSNTRRCAPDCDSAPATGRGRVLGCPACWKSAGTWAPVTAFGSQHGFDLLAADGKQSLAVCIELSRARLGRLPSPDVQRFLGQCAMAATRHPLVVGFFAYHGSLQPKWERDSERAAKALKKGNIQLVFRSTWNARMVRDSEPFRVPLR